MNRTDRLYAIVEELRAIAPRTRAARELAVRFEVSMRTIERDISALQQSGVPIYAETGRRGGYALEKSMSLPPLNFTPAEAVAVAVALSRAGQVPFAEEARSALRKVLAAMPSAAGADARELAGRVQMLSAPGTEPNPARLPRIIEEAVLHQRVLKIEYGDRFGESSIREVEPVALVAGPKQHWYLVGWCRLRADARAFRLDRILVALETGEVAPARPPEEFAPRTELFVARVPSLD